MSSLRNLMSHFSIRRYGKTTLNHTIKLCVCRISRDISSLIGGRTVRNCVCWLRNIVSYLQKIKVTFLKTNTIFMTILTEPLANNSFLLNLIISCL